MVTKRTGLLSFLGSGDVYDPDRLAFDQQKLRQFYLTNGYADFRVVSAVAELTPDRRDFIITYVVEEGERYKFGDVKVESAIRDFSSEALTELLPMKKGDWYNAKQVEDTVTSLNESAGLFGYAFADVQPNFRARQGTPRRCRSPSRSPRRRASMSSGSTSTATRSTRDKVIRREFRLAEGDPFNSVRVKRSRDRIQSLGFFQDNLEIEQTQGSAPDRVILVVDVEEKATGELQVSAGFSSLERFLVNLSIAQRNFMGKGQELRASVNYSSYSKSVELGFTEPYLFDRNIAVGFDLYRRDYSASTSSTTTATPPTSRSRTGGQLRVRHAAHRIYAAAAFATASTRRGHARRERSSSPIPTAPGRCPPSAIRSGPAAICATRSASERPRRSAIRCSTIRPTTASARRAAIASRSTRISPASAATSNICGPASTPPNIGSVGGGFIFSTSSRAATSTASRAAPARIRIRSA